MTLVIAIDDGEFKESEHPRDKKGEFAKSGSSGTSSSTSSEPDDDDKEDKDDASGGGPEGHRVARPVRKVLKQAGFKKLHGNKEEIRFFHPDTGLRVIIHKNPSALKSDIWSVKESAVGPEVDKGQGYKGLAQTLKKMIAQAQQGLAKPAYSPPPATTPAPTPVKPASSPPASAATAPKQAPTPANPAPTQEEALNLEVAKAGSPELWLQGKGYKELPPVGKYAGAKNLTLSKKESNGGLIEYNHDTNEWTASTPGFGTKEGQGFLNLQKLLSGVTSFVGGKPWKTSYKSLVDTSNAEAVSLEQAQSKHQQQQKAYSTVWVPAAPEPTTSEENAIGTYTASGYATINESLRYNPEFANTSKTVKNLDTYLKKTTIPEDAIIYRKVDGDYAKILKSIVIKGSSFVDRGYASTSGTEATWHGSLKMVIKVKKGQRGAAVYKWSSHKSENEIILPRLSAYKVDDYDPKKQVLYVTLDQSHLDEYMEKGYS